MAISEKDNVEWLWEFLKKSMEVPVIILSPGTQSWDADVWTGQLPTVHQLLNPCFHDLFEKSFAEVHESSYNCHC